MYAIQITPETAVFIGTYLNDGVIPDFWERNTFFIFGDDKPSEIITQQEFTTLYGARIFLPSAHLYTVR